MNKEIKSLYRVHRPKQFTDVIGQPHITKTLINQITRGTVGHAYLFCGTRGTGKTSVAKIFANAVNCLNFKNGEMCGVCDYCKRIGFDAKQDGSQNASGTSAAGNIDVFELDAASNNRVEDVRELIEKVKYPPVFAKYKVYIVDEVHMFSSSAFNAFLKTLEEPPSHVIFILCTTESHKLLPTVQSRCLRFDFRSVSVANISTLLERVFEKEKINATPEVIKQIAEAGNGSFRDALSFADMLGAYASRDTGGHITIKESDVNEVLGAVDNKTLHALLESILSEDIKEAVKTTNDIFAVGRNANAVVKDFMEVIKNRYIETQNTALMEIYQTFAEIEQTIKTASSAHSMFQGAVLLSIASKKKLKTAN